ncbi:hypothetical protein T4E_505 [Trichinella pseudospiralis]|uniref:Uncharacterized protein n=1 Tax=Trichinella pseudospiralis TaxID=6337 RepID=A0A0V0XK07_TRIPS|nr:hypothetical protein T4E_505 [Trichinella pseudospiralis]
MTMASRFMAKKTTRRCHKSLYKSTVKEGKKRFNEAKVVLSGRNREKKPKCCWEEELQFSF